MYVYIDNILYIDVCVCICMYENQVRGDAGSPGPGAHVIFYYITSYVFTCYMCYISYVHIYIYIYRERERDRDRERERLHYII